MIRYEMHAAKPVYFPEAGLAADHALKDAHGIGEITALRDFQEAFAL